MRLFGSLVPVLQYVSNNSTNLETQLPFDLQGKTFSRVFGTSTALFERFVLERKVMGPCWLQIVDPDFTKAQNVLPRLKLIEKVNMDTS
jgi:hypothetical protein